MQEITGFGLKSLAILCAQLTREGCCYTAQVKDGGEEDDRYWTITVKGY